jgi:hypothetical protein
MNDSISWSELAELTHATQVERFNFCTCEDNEGQDNPYEDCPKSEETLQERADRTNPYLLKREEK